MGAVGRDEPHIAGTVAQQLVNVGIEIGGGSGDHGVSGQRVRIRFDLFLIQIPFIGVQSQILAAGDFGIELRHILGEHIQIVGSVLFAGPVKRVFPFHRCPPFGMSRIRIAIVDLICENVVLILIGHPVIQAEFGAEGHFITGEIVCAVQIGRIAFLRVGMVFMHLLKYMQIIFRVVDGRIPEFLIIIPAYDIASLGGLVAESYTVIPDLGREEIESPIFVPELFEYVIRRPDIPFEQIWDIFLQIRRGIQGYAVLQDLGQVVACGDNVRQIAAGQSGFILLRCYIRIIDVHA